jgi:hypothetical protein
VRLRAADGGAPVRVVEVAAPTRSYVAPVDQLVARDGATRWVVLGDEAVEVDLQFIRSIQFLAIDARPSYQAASTVGCGAVAAPRAAASL